MGYAKNDAEKIKFALVNGATGNTAITVTGIATEDVLVSVMGWKVVSGVLTVTNFTSNFAITAANTIKSATDTSSNFLQVVYIDRSAG